MFDLFQFLGDEDSVITILDVGAAFTQEPPYQHLLDIKRAKVIGFEPDERACLELSARFGSPHRFFPYFIGDGKPGTYWETNWGPTGSIFEPNLALLDKFQLLAEVTKPVATHIVSTRRLDDMHEIDDVDFVKIDVQGSELGIFQNAKRVLGSALLIQTEVSFVESYVGQSMFSDIDSFLRTSGYQFHDFLGFGSRAFKPAVNPANYSPNPCLSAFRQKIWADAYYVKDWMKLGDLPLDKLVKYAVLMHDIVRSYDLAYLILRELSRRDGGDIATRYINLMQDWGRCSVIDPVGYDKDWMPKLSPVDAMETAEVKEGQAIDSIVLQTSDGTLVSVPTDLTCTATYVLLEQERWMEKELAFLMDWLRPGMNAIDIGANVGVYSLPFAKRIGPEGSVFAFEPGSENRRNLEVGRLANRLGNLSISSIALAESERTGWLKLEVTGDLNSLVDQPELGEDVEQVQVSTLDALSGRFHWPQIDLVKIDAEGQDANIVDGGRRFFESNSPLVMFEVVHFGHESRSAGPLFESMGYRIFRLLGDQSFLVPMETGEALDEYEVNLFAAKPDRVATLAASGHLALSTESVALSLEEELRAIEGLLSQPFARHFEFSIDDVRGCEHSQVLIAYSAYRFAGLSPGRRLGLLRDAYVRGKALCAHRPTAAGLSTFVRISHALGYRRQAGDALLRMLEIPLGDLDAPFFPPCPRYESLSPGDQEHNWFGAAVIEQLELVRSHSSRFTSQDGFENLTQLCDGPFASAEMLRRIILKGILSNWPPAKLAGYIQAVEGYSHCNAEFWGEEHLAGMIGEVWAARNGHRT